MILKKDCSTCYLSVMSPFSSTQANIYTPTGTEAGDAYPSADPTGNADTCLPICYCTLRQWGRKADWWDRERSILTTQRIVRMLVVCPIATVFLINDFCWIDTFCWAAKMHLVLRAEANGTVQQISSTTI